MSITALTEVKIYVCVTLYIRCVIANACLSESRLCTALSVQQTKHQLSMVVFEPLDMQLQVEFVRLC